MADEAFALSPISARPVEPGEADYEAISAAFMETSRGRWFLGEYARRNRNADTRMVLDAVARIEENLAAQKPAAADDRLPAALQAIRQAVDEARAAAAQAGARAEQSLAPIRSAAQIIRETLMRLREIGADGRIYDVMDRQVSAIESGCAQPDLIDAATALTAAFDLIEQRIGEFDADDPNRPPASGPSTAPSAAADETAFAVPAPSADIVAVAPIEAAAEDDAVLDMIALEMGAPDFADDDADAFYSAGVDTVEAIVIPEPVPVPQAEPEQVAQPSLGASLIANGIVRSADTAVTDPLAPIRRMSQAEKIAFFS